MVKIHLKKKNIIKYIWLTIVIVSSLALVGASLLPVLSLLR